MLTKFSETRGWGGGRVWHRLVTLSGTGFTAPTRSKSLRSGNPTPCKERSALQITWNRRGRVVVCWFACLVRFKTVAMRSKKSICAPPGLSAVSPTLPVKWSLCSYGSMTMALSRPFKFKEDRLMLPLSKTTFVVYFPWYR